MNISSHNISVHENENDTSRIHTAVTLDSRLSITDNDNDDDDMEHFYNEFPVERLHERQQQAPFLALVYDHVPSETNDNADTETAQLVSPARTWLVLVALMAMVLSTSVVVVHQLSSHPQFNLVASLGLAASLAVLVVFLCLAVRLGVVVLSPQPQAPRCTRLPWVLV